MVSPKPTAGAADEQQHVTLVAEKLEGRCLRCAGQTTSSETVSDDTWRTHVAGARG